MPKKLWKVRGPLQLRNTLTQAYQYAAPYETLEEVTMPGTTNSRDDVRVFREDRIQSYVVTREALEANATLISE